MDATTREPQILHMVKARHVEIASQVLVEFVTLIEIDTSRELQYPLTSVIDHIETLKM